MKLCPIQISRLILEISPNDPITTSDQIVLNTL